MLVVVVLFLAVSVACFAASVFCASFAHRYFQSAVPTCGGHWVGMSWVSLGWGSPTCSVVVHNWELLNQVAEGLAVVGVLVPFVLVLKFCAPSLLSRPISLPKVVAVSVILTSIALGTTYLSTMAIDRMYAYSQFNLGFKEDLTAARTLQVMEGLAASLATVLVLSSLRFPSFLSRRFDLPKPVRASIFLMSLALVGLYLWTVMIDLMYNIPSSRALAESQISRYFWFQSFQTCPPPPMNVWPPLPANFLTCSALGAMGFLFLAGATIGLTVFGLNKGVLQALRNAIGFCTLPAILILQIGLLHFDYREMAIHAANFTRWSVGGVDIVSNWFVLTVALSLILLSYAPLLSKKVSVRR